MATKKSTKVSAVVSKFRVKTKKRRKGIHAKNCASKSKKSKNYIKRYVGQGR